MIEIAEPWSSHIKAIRFLALLTTLLCVLGADAQGPTWASIPESLLRKNAIKKSMPIFPRESKRRGSKGPAVVSVEINEAGELTGATVLQAPDAFISKAVHMAIYNWRFRPVRLIGGKPVRIKSKLTFYFLYVDGKPRVQDPSQFSN